MQPDFVRAVLRRCHDAGLHTALVPEAQVQPLMPPLLSDEAPARLVEAADRQPGGSGGFGIDDKWLGDGRTESIGAHLTAHPRAGYVELEATALDANSAASIEAPTSVVPLVVQAPAALAVSVVTPEQSEDEQSHDGLPSQGSTASVKRDWIHTSLPLLFWPMAVSPPDTLGCDCSRGRHGQRRPKVPLCLVPEYYWMRLLQLRLIERDTKEPPASAGGSDRWPDRSDRDGSWASCPWPCSCRSWRRSSRSRPGS